MPRRCRVFLCDGVCIVEADEDEDTVKGAIAADDDNEDEDDDGGDRNRDGDTLAGAGEDTDFRFSPRALLTSFGLLFLCLPSFSGVCMLIECKDAIGTGTNDEDKDDDADTDNDADADADAVADAVADANDAGGSTGGGLSSP